MDSWEEFPIICMKFLGEQTSRERRVGGRNHVGFQVYFLAKAPSKSVWVSVLRSSHQGLWTDKSLIQRDLSALVSYVPNHRRSTATKAPGIISSLCGEIQWCNIPRLWERCYDHKGLKKKASVSFPFEQELALEDQNQILQAVNFVHCESQYHIHHVSNSQYPW